MWNPRSNSVSIDQEAGDTSQRLALDLNSVSVTGFAMASAIDEAWPRAESLSQLEAATSAPRQVLQALIMLVL